MANMSPPKKKDSKVETKKSGTRSKEGPSQITENKRWENYQKEIAQRVIERLREEGKIIE